MSSEIKLCLITFVYMSLELFHCFKVMIISAMGIWTLNQGRIQDLQKEGAECQNWGKIG